MLLEINKRNLVIVLALAAPLAVLGYQNMQRRERDEAERAERAERQGAHRARGPSALDERADAYRAMLERDYSVQSVKAGGFSGRRLVITSTDCPRMHDFFVVARYEHKRIWDTVECREGYREIWTLEL